MCLPLRVIQNRGRHALVQCEHVIDLFYQANLVCRTDLNSLYGQQWCLTPLDVCFVFLGPIGIFTRGEEPHQCG